MSCEYNLNCHYQEYLIYLSQHYILSTCKLCIFIFNKLNDYLKLSFSEFCFFICLRYKQIQFYLKSIFQTSLHSSTVSIVSFITNIIRMFKTVMMLVCWSFWCDVVSVELQLSYSILWSDSWIVYISHHICSRNQHWSTVSLLKIW